MIKFSHTVFALPFALLSAALAWRSSRSFHWLDLLGILLCMVFARSAAMAFNRLVDRDFDAKNPRTAMRHLPMGLLSARFVAVFTGLSCLGFVASCALFTRSGNFWPLVFSLPVLLFLLAYSFAKRFTMLAHVWLGAALMLAPLAAWIAILGLEDLLQPALIAGAVLCWVSGFDIIYACQDVEFDRSAGLYSIPAHLGVPRALWLAALLHAVMVGFLIVLWAVSPVLYGIFLAGVIACAALLAFEHFLVSPSDLRRVNAAFLYVNGIISIGLLACVVLQLICSS